MGGKDLEQIKSMTIDFELNYIEVRTVDGRVVRQERSSTSMLVSATIDYKRVTWRPGDLLMTLVTVSGEELEVEVFGNDDGLARRRSRPVIY